MKRVQVVFLCLGLLVPLACVSGQMAREENVVRTTYAKLAFAVKIGEIHDVLAREKDPSLAELENQVSANELRFELSNFKSGYIRTIVKKSFAELVTKPQGEDVLDIATGVYNSTEDVKELREVRETTELGAHASWSAGEYLTQDWNVSFAQMLPATQTQNNSTYDRYASYHVRVTYQGRSRSYEAMFLFGSGEIPVLALDNVTNNSALTSIVDKSVYPSVLLESPASRQLGVAAWLRSHQIRDAACRPGQKEACCDPASVSCGVAAGDVSSALRNGVSRRETFAS